jgi:hypothetical protein
MGESSRFIIAMILKESAIICCSGTIFGIGINEVLKGFRKVLVANRLDDMIRSLGFGFIAGN